MRVLFTGIVGMELKGHLRKLTKFVRESTSYGRSAQVLKAEKYFLPILRKEKPFFPDSFDLLPKNRQMIYALGLPKPLLRQSWSTAVDKLLQEDQDAKMDDTFLCAHIVFHHQWTREFFSPVDVTLIAAWKPEFIVTLVDDTENCLDRLRQEGHMFSSMTYSYAGMDGFSNSLDHMRLLFDWRAAEILAAERLAADIEVSHFCIATKHPLETVLSLLHERARPIGYISHPISEPRRNLAAGEHALFAEFVVELRETCSRLRRGITLIEPTTIDEFRLRRTTYEEAGAERVAHLPHHTERWPVPENSMWVAPTKIEENPLDPDGFFGAELLDQFAEAKARFAEAEAKGEDFEWTPEFIRLDTVASLLKVLVGHMTEQIDARDHKLVEQSDGLIVLRPVYLGNPSQGVEEEVKYHCQLCLSGASRELGLWIYTHRDDEFAYLCKKWIVSYLERRLSARELRGTGDDDADMATIRKIACSLPYSEDRAELAKELLCELGQQDIQLVGEYSGKPLESKPERESVESQIRFIQELNLAKPPYMDWIEHYAAHSEGLRFEIREGPEISLDKFIEEVLQSVAKQS